MVRSAVAGIFLQIIPQILPPENIDAHRGQIVFGLGRFFLELDDPVVDIRVHDAESPRILPRHLDHRQRRIGFPGLVILHHLGIVHLVNVIAGQNHNPHRIVLVDKGDVLKNGVRRSLVPFSARIVGIGRQDKNAAVLAVKVPGAADAHIAVEKKWLILGQDTHRVNPRIAAVRKRKINDAVFAAERNRRFGDRLGQSPQPRSLAAGKNHRNALFLRHSHSPFQIGGQACFLEKQTKPSGGTPTARENGQFFQRFPATNGAVWVAPVPPYSARSLLNTSWYSPASGTPIT